MARARILLTASRVWWEEHSLSGYGATPEAAVADYEETMRELAADGLEPALPFIAPRASADVGHSAHGPGGVRGYRYGHGLVRIRKVAGR